MEAVDEFRVDLDISHCTKLHDYATGSTLTRPQSQEWDQALFKGLGTTKDIPEDDEEKQLLVYLTDLAIMEKGFLEKKMKIKDDKKTEDDSYNIFGEDFGDHREEPHLPRRVVPFYKRGDPVRGRIVLKINQKIDAEKLTIRFVGQAFVNIRIYVNQGRPQDVWEYEKFVKEEQTVWRKTGSSEERSDTSSISDSFALLSTAAPSPSQSAELAPGTYSYPFEFSIPDTAAQSMPPATASTTNKAYVIYRIKATIDKGNMFSRGNIVTHKGLWVEHDYDIASEPANLQPVLKEDTLDTGMMQFWKSGKLNVRVSLPQGAYIKGDPIPVTVEVDNQSKGEIQKVSARIAMVGKARTGTSRLSLSQSLNVKSKKISEGPIAAGMSPRFSWELPWDFSTSSVDGALLPVGDMDDSKLIDIAYNVVVNVKRKGLHRNMTLQMPIKVGNGNSREAAAAFSGLYPELN